MIIDPQSIQIMVIYALCRQLLRVISTNLPELDGEGGGLIVDQAHCGIDKILKVTVPEIDAFGWLGSISGTVTFKI